MKYTLALLLSLYSTTLYANGEKLYGVHWWSYNGSQVGSGAVDGWSSETVITHSAPWWQAPFFQPLYQEIYNNHGAGIITRIDYNWGETIPSPTNPDRANWVNSVLGVVNTLGGQSQTWIIGNEPNIIGEGNNWPDGRVTPQGYAQVYHEVRTAIKAIRPHDEVLLAPPSPGGTIPGVRWMPGNTWLSQTIAAVDAIPGGSIDGFAIHAYGSPFLSGQAAVDAFRGEYTSQLAVIGSHGYHDAPVYITEWNRATSTTGNLAANEAVTADFIRGAFADVHDWNQTPGNHNIVSMSWFVHNKHYGGWEQYSLEHWQTQGNPVGHPGDLWTAFQEGAQYPAGLKGTRPFPSGAEIGDFDEDGDIDGHDFLQWQRGDSPTPLSTGDLDLWQQNFGTTATANQAVAVPEPTGLLLIGAMLLMLPRRPSMRHCIGTAQE